MAIAGDSSNCDVTTLLQHCPAEELNIDWAYFLQLVCGSCAAFTSCARNAELLALAERIVSLAVQHTLAAFVCVQGLLAAAVIGAQFGLQSALPEDVVISLNVSGDLPLTPFPLRASQHTLFSTFAPAASAFCRESEVEELGFRKFVPSADIRNARCASLRSDVQLVDLCRSRIAHGDVFPEAAGGDREGLPDWVLAFAAQEGHELAERRARFASLSCPPLGNNTAAVQLSDMEKYKQRVAEGGCESPRGVWGTALEDGHKCVLVVVAELLRFRPGQLLLDWGSGCGFTLSWAKTLFDVDGLGIEATPSAAAWSSRFSLGQSCAADGRHLEWIPEDLFDHVFSYGALLHLDFEEQCAVATELIRKLRIGGGAFLGWNRAHRVLPWSWYACFGQASGLKVSVEVIEEWLLFPAERKDAADNFLWQYPSYSVLLTRLA